VSRRAGVEMKTVSEEQMEKSFKMNCFEKEGHMTYSDFAKKADYDIRLMQAKKAGKIM
jgi:hypothetical protein